MRLSHHDWSLHRKGPADQARHNAKIRQAIKDNLADIIAEESIITSDGNKVVKIPLRSLEQYRFRFDEEQGERIGTGDGTQKPGDVIARREQGAGTGAGGGEGVDYYEVDVTVDDLADLLFEDLGLPYLRPTAYANVASDDVQFRDVRRKGVMPNLDKRRTIKENIKRNAMAGNPAFGGISDDDLRFKTWQTVTRPRTSAVLLAMRDVSGSMGEFKKYISRSVYFWMTRFLRTRYQDIDLVFITHHTAAKEVDEKTFFELGESGGTRVSSAYQLCHEIIAQRYDPALWNSYVIHFSDGDNWGESDNRLCLELVQRLLETCNLFGYGEIRETGYNSTLSHTFSAIGHPRFRPVVITQKSDVYAALKTLFAPPHREVARA